VTPDESLAWLYGLQQFGIKLGLQNVRELLRRLDNPQNEFRCVHVAGTNGKGSVSAFLAEMLHQADYRVGLYTSPHLHSFTERVRLDGEPLKQELLPALAQKVRGASAGIPVTFFEATTALALVAFREAVVDVAVLETGMGGRLDATSAVDPVLSLITPVSFDHQEYLGETLPAITAEKAGIIKPGVPVIVGRQFPEAAAVIAGVAAGQQAPLWLAQRDYHWGGDHAAMWFRGPGLELFGLRCALQGAHQLDNFAQALAGTARLRLAGWQIPSVALHRAGVAVRWPGRLEWWGSPPTVLLDGAHNASGAAALARYLVEEVRRPVRLVAALSGQRHPDEVLGHLKEQLLALYASPVPEGTTTVSAQVLSDWAHSEGIPARTFVSPTEALTAALAECEEGEVVVAAGSLYLVAAVRGQLCADAAWSLSAVGKN
jgi:dihydrofolate synthase/folylpolyglutamate synthase